MTPGQADYGQPPRGHPVPCRRSGGHHASRWAASRPARSLNVAWRGSQPGNRSARPGGYRPSAAAVRRWRHVGHRDREYPYQSLQRLCWRCRGTGVVDDPVELGMHTGGESGRASTGMRIAHFCDSHQDRPDGVATAVATTVSLLRGAGHEVQLYQPAPLLGGRGEPYGVRSVPVPLRDIRVGVPRFGRSAAAPRHRPHPHGRAHRDRRDEICTGARGPRGHDVAHRPARLLRLLPRDTDRRRARRAASPARLDGPRLPAPGPARHRTPRPAASAR